MNNICPTNVLNKCIFQKNKGALQCISACEKKAMLAENMQKAVNWIEAAGFEII